MIKAKSLSRSYRPGGRFDWIDYHSRMAWLGSEVKQLNRVGQTSLGVRMSKISKPTYERVLEKVARMGYIISDDHYLYDSSEGVFTIGWALGKE